MLKKLSLIFLISLFVFSLAGCSQTNSSDVAINQEAVTENEITLTVYSGAGLSKPVEEIGKLYEEKTGIKISYIFGGSAQLNNQILLTQKGDIYIPGDIAEQKPLEEKNLILESKDMVYHIPVLVVQKENPKQIQSLNDLQKDGLKIALGDPETNPIGKVSNKLLEKYELLEAVSKNVVVRTATVSELVLYVSEKQADAAIIWKENYDPAKDKMDKIDIPELLDFVKTVPVTILQTTEQPDAAKQFYDFMSQQEAIQIWEKWGYQTIIH